MSLGPSLALVSYKYESVFRALVLQAMKIIMKKTYPKCKLSLLKDIIFGTRQSVVISVPGVRHARSLTQQFLRPSKVVGRL